MLWLEDTWQVLQQRRVQMGPTAEGGMEIGQVRENKDKEKEEGGGEWQWMGQ